MISYWLRCLTVTPGRPGCSRVVGRVRQVEIVVSFRASSLILELLLFTSTTGDHELHISHRAVVSSRSLVQCLEAEGLVLFELLV